MDFVNFQALVSNLRNRKPNWFKLESDPTATDVEINAAQSGLGAKFPKAYCEFVREFGGGDFVFGNVFSVSAGSEWNIVQRNLPIEVSGFIAVSDNGVGDLYGLQVASGHCEDRILFLDHEEGSALKATQYPDLFEFLIDTALRY